MAGGGGRKAAEIFDACELGRSILFEGAEGAGCPDEAFSVEFGGRRPCEERGSVVEEWGDVTAIKRFRVSYEVGH